jgi:alanine dehydrogenase
VSDNAGTVRLIGSDMVDALATVELGLAAAEQAARLSRDKVVSGRVQVNGKVSWMRVLAGSLTALDLTGYKEFHRVGQRVRYHVHLFRESTGDALGVVDGRRITSLRTSCTAAVAVRKWAAGRPVRVGMIGSGEEAREGLRALHGAIKVTRASVYSPTPANRKAFAISMSDLLGLDVTAADTQDNVLADCDVLYVATSSHHNAFLGRSMLANVPMVAAIGSTQPVHRELFGDAFFDATVIVDTPDALHESGDCLEAVDQGWDPTQAILLGKYLAGAVHREGRTVFKSIGSVEQDLVLAAHLLEAAARESRGVTVDPIGSLRIMR